MAEPVRILQVFHSMDCGGAENMIMNLYRQLDREKMQFDFLVHSDHTAYFDEEIRSLGGRIFVVPYFNGRNVAGYRKALRDFFSAHPEYKVVHGHVGSCAHIYLKVAKEYGCYTILHSHNTRKKLSVKQILFRIFTIRARKTADYFMSCGEAAGDYLFGKNITADKNRYTILKNAIDTEKFLYQESLRRKKREELGVKDAFLIGHVGRFDYQKNHEFLIDIFQKIQEKNPDSRLICIGDGSLRSEIEEKAQKLGLSKNIIFAGLRRDVAELMMAMDVLLFPSHNEGLPVTVIEAQAAGLAVIMSDAITGEVKITDLVETVSLQEPAKYWADKVLAKQGYERRSRKTEIADAGYDIHTTVEWLMKFYRKEY